MMMILLLVLEVGYNGDHDDEEVDEERKKKTISCNFGIGQLTLRTRCFARVVVGIFVPVICSFSLYVFHCC